MTTYTQKHNAKAAACKMIAQGKTPGGALDFEIVQHGPGRPDGDRFAIVWGAAMIAPEPVEDFDEPEAEARAPAADVPARKAGTQLAKVIAMLQRPEGATIADLQAATGWLPHTARAFISVQVRRKAGLEVITGKVEGRGRVYRVAA
jgi:Protein of unknown function (DUF3489)